MGEAMFFRLLVLSVLIVGVGKTTNAANTPLDSPEGIAFQSIGPNTNTLWVANYNSDTVVELSLPFPSTGGVASAAMQPITTQNSKGVGGPTRIALDSAGNLYVALSKGNIVQVYVKNSNGTYNLTNPIVLSEGLNRPLGIAVDNDEHTLFVASNAPDPKTGKTMLNIYQNFIPKVGMSSPPFTPVPINPAPGAMWVGRAGLLPITGFLTSVLLIANGPSSEPSTVDAYDISTLPTLPPPRNPINLESLNTGPTGIAVSSASQIGLVISCLYSGNVVFNLNNSNAPPSSVGCPTCEGVAVDDPDGLLFATSTSLGSISQSGGIQVYQYPLNNKPAKLVNQIVAYH